MKQSAPRVVEADRNQLELRPFDLDSTIAPDHRARLVWRANATVCAVAVLSVIGCARGTPPNSTLREQMFFLCCTTRFNQDRDASDANYSYPGGGFTLTAGTRVRVVDVGRTWVSFIPSGTSERFSLDVRFGNDRVSPRDYFRNLLRTSDPREALAGAPEEIVRAVSEGRLVKGMTKSQAILARGYPPAHRTLDTNSNEWLYYQDRGLVDRVRFVDGRIAEIDTVWSGSL